MTSTQFMEVIEKSAKRNDGGHTVEAVWRAISSEINKNGNKVLCEPTSDLRVFKANSLDDTYQNIVKNLLRIDLETIKKEIKKIAVVPMQIGTDSQYFGNSQESCEEGLSLKRNSTQLYKGNKEGLYDPASKRCHADMDIPIIDDPGDTKRRIIPTVSLIKK